jgi:GNAT superfamily N-acetyltransferase
VINHEKYNNRIRVAQFLVLHGYRNMGIGKLLMKHAEDYARAMILKTQSCNILAINFYLRYGFQFVGCDVMCYSNHDIENKEVRLELGKAIGQIRLRYSNKHFFKHVQLLSKIVKI